MSIWKRWADKVNSKTGMMQWIFLFVLVSCILLVGVAYYTGGLRRLWGVKIGGGGGGASASALPPIVKAATGGEMAEMAAAFV